MSASSRLARTQGDFQDFLLRPDTQGRSPMLDHVIGTERFPVETRLAIYANAYGSRLIEALQANFPALAALMGEADFHALGTQYVRAHDSSFFSIRYYGHQLDRFLASHADYSAAPVVAELARWEWTLTEVFDAADATPIEVSALGQIPPEDWAELRLDWHPSLRRMDLAWNVPQLWKAVTAEAERPELVLSSEAVPWILWRQDLHTYFRSLQPAEAAALDAARTGQPFGELCELLCARVGEEQAPAQAAGFLRGWVESGLIVGLR